MRIERFILEFVETMPAALSEGTLYISMVYAVARHLCACGCGEEVVTMFTPTDWKLTFDGEHVSLQPSIGNWSFACRSHYWITDNGPGTCQRMRLHGAEREIFARKQLISQSLKSRIRQKAPCLKRPST